MQTCILITSGVTLIPSKLRLHPYLSLFLLPPQSPFHPLFLNVFYLLAAQNVVIDQQCQSSGLVRNAGSQAIQDLMEQSLRFNKIPMRSKGSLNFEESGSGTCLHDPQVAKPIQNVPSIREDPFSFSLEGFLVFLNELFYGHTHTHIFRESLGFQRIAKCWGN